MRRFLPALMALLALTAVAAVALAQTAPIVTPEFKVTPKKAGSKRKPVNALVYTKGTLSGEGDYTLSRLEYTIPRTIRIDGKGFPTCCVEFVNANGDDDCPKASKVGTGAATAELGPSANAARLRRRGLRRGPESAHHLPADQPLQRRHSRRDQGPDRRLRPARARPAARSGPLRLRHECHAEPRQAEGRAGGGHPQRKRFFAATIGCRQAATPARSRSSSHPTPTRRRCPRFPSAPRRVARK